MSEWKNKRVLMKLYKEDKKLILINVSEDVYNTFDVTGFTDLFSIQKSERFFAWDHLD